jgi:hypothetical protein
LAFYSVIIIGVTIAFIAWYLIEQLISTLRSTISL